ncbi:hypothetical protein [Streptomyces sp. NPDC048436]|uniref:hypothetical protein n=1 Tax=Streptomyces sp. NPDC048436 TaxID=3365550 RepID=UPI0037153E56
MPQFSPASALATCEQALRDLITTVLTTQIGKDWISQVFTAEKLEKLRQIREEETGRRTRRGTSFAPGNELAYAQFFDVIGILKKHWEHFKPALGDQIETLGLLKRFEAMRNSVAHSRELLPFEEELLSGIAGEIRNKVTIYMSSRDPVGTYFARIDSVTDSFGNCISNLPQDPMEHGAWLRTGLVLHPGDTVTFQCRGTDPQDRELTWWMLPNYEAESPRRSGRDVELTWKVSDHDVAARCDVHLYMRSSGMHHRVNGMAPFDHCASFVYTVLPRDGETP